jgi:hypothetical protein
MESAFQPRYLRAGINVFFVYAGLAAFAAGLLMVRLSRNWTISDWLINYQGGFIRRGLPGQIAFSLGHFLHVSPVFFAALFYLSLLLALVIAFRSLALATSYNVWVLALIVSPATLSFAILHPQAGFRKEIIFLSALALFALLLRKSQRSSLWVVVFMTIVLTVGTLSHEVVIFYSPYFFAALILGGRSVPRALRECVIPFAAGAAVLYVCSTHLGNYEVAAKVCSSLGYKLLVPGSTEICSSGAIPYLTKSREAAQAEAFALIREHRYWATYPFFAALALVPAIGESLVLARSGLNREMRVLWITAAITLAASLPLFAFGIDWGRWIYIHVFSIAMLLMLADARARAEKPLPANEVPGGRSRERLAASIFLFVYAACWSMPVSTEAPRMGYMGRALAVMHHGKWSRSHASAD